MNETSLECLVVTCESPIRPHTGLRILPSRSKSGNSYKPGDVIIFSCDTNSKPEKKVSDQLNGNCHELNDNCIECKVNYSCVYGQQLDLNCRPIEGIACIGETNFTRRHLSAFCYQLPQHLYNWSPNSSCDYNSRYNLNELNNNRRLC
ncbi:unnamed protein product [Medioppia subpectinata]|uniref:Uncharacterized protein n=1 Tax=Medioppia subpectinata TaxID=1979941 RepID=A0A7R9KU50_9ACAR|nr:unnamed protein product [Medioppia subpectinata]CAG2109911.1 unnamed protein product [Medioppia subpectinata]